MENGVVHEKLSSFYAQIIRDILKNSRICRIENDDWQEFLSTSDSNVLININHYNIKFDHRISIFNPLKRFKKEVDVQISVLTIGIDYEAIKIKSVQAIDHLDIFMKIQVMRKNLLSLTNITAS